MALVHLICTADASKSRYSRRDYERLVKFAGIDRLHQHALVDSAKEADIIIFVSSSEPAYRDVRNSDIYRKYPKKSVLIESGDRCIPLLPGVYAGLEKRWARLNCGSAISGFYIRVAENTSMDIEEPIEESSVLYSFVGSSKNHPVRNRILKLRDDRAFLRDSSQDTVQQADGIGGVNKDRGQEFRDVIANSKFVLCPRGIGVSSWRLFETMKAGRVPVIISDQWVPPMGPQWDEFSIRIRERDIKRLPEILLENESRAPLLGQQARSEWLRFYDQTVIFNTVVDNCLYALSQFTRRNKFIYSCRRLQYLDPYFARYWLISPWLRKHVRKTKNI